jgi:hypothetical protein
LEKKWLKIKPRRRAKGGLNQGLKLNRIKTQKAIFKRIGDFVANGKFSAKIVAMNSF